LRRGVQARFAAELREPLERLGGLPAFERDLRFEHQAWHGEVRRLRIRPLEHRARTREVAGFERRARADERRDRRRLRNRERLLRKLSRLAVPPLEQGDDGRILLRTKALVLAALASLAHFLRELRKAYRGADQRV
jgi:hypothetical protein